MEQHAADVQDARCHRELLRMGITSLRTKQGGRELIIQCVEHAHADQDDEQPQRDVDGLAELSRPVVKVEIQDHGRNQHHDGQFAAVQIPPVRSVNPFCTVHCGTPGQILHEVERIEQQHGEREHAEEADDAADDLVMNQAERIAVKRNFQHPDGDRSAHDPPDVVVAVQRVCKTIPPGIRCRIFLERPEEYVIMRMHQAEEEQHRGKQRDHEYRKAAGRLFHVLPGMVPEADRHNRAQPGSDGREHQDRQGRIFSRVERRHVQLDQLVDAQIRNGESAQEVIEEAPDYASDQCEVDQDKHRTGYDGMRFLPELAEGPEVEDIGLPDNDDQNPTNVHVAVLRGVPAHDAAHIHEHPPDGVEDGK